MRVTSVRGGGRGVGLGGGRGRQERRRGAWVEGLEGRRLLTVAVTGVLPGVSVGSGVTTPGTVDLSAYFKDAAVPANTVFMNTNLGVIPVQLTPAATPLTVQNFMNYVTSGRYNGTVFHRSVPGFVIQAGGYALHGTSLDQVLTDAKVKNEFAGAQAAVGGGNVNVRGTIAMAKVGLQKDGSGNPIPGTGPDSASSQWFFNLGNNSHAIDPQTQTDNGLDVQNGGFTVFGKVIGNGMSVVDAIAAVQIAQYSGDFGSTPLLGYDGPPAPPPVPPQINQLVQVETMTSGASYTVTSDDASIVSVDVHDSRLVYTPGGKNGVAHVTVTAAGLDGQTVSRTFAMAVGVPLPTGGNDGGGGTEPQGTTTPVKVGKGGFKTVTFKDGDGTTVTVSVKGPGTATINFTGDGVVAKAGKGGAGSVTGTGLGVAGIDVSGGAGGTVVAVTTKGGNGAVDIGGIHATGAMGTFDGKGVNLVGASVISGGVKSFAVKSAGASSSVQAGGVGTISVGGTMAGVWKVGSVKKLSAGTISGATVQTTGGGQSMGTVTAKKVISSQIRSAGSIGGVVVGSMSASQVFAGIGADAVGSADAAAHGSGQIVSVKVGGGKGGNAFADSAIAAKVIKKAVVGNIVDAASAAAFYGVEADSIVKMTGFVGGKAFAIKNAQTQAQVDAQLAKEKVALKDVEVVVV